MRRAGRLGTLHRNPAMQTEELVDAVPTPVQPKAPVERATIGQRGTHSQPGRNMKIAYKLKPLLALLATAVLSCTALFGALMLTRV
jgi:hypothetical protein